MYAKGFDVLKSSVCAFNIEELKALEITKALT